jgi:hypothetical protein
LKRIQQSKSFASGRRIWKPGQFWVLGSAEPEKLAMPKSAHGVSVQIMRRADLMAFDRRIDNWSQILPYSISFARYPDGRL